MNEVGLKGSKASIAEFGFKSIKKAYWNLTPSELIEHAIRNNEGHLCDNGAFAADTGEFTGRSPKDRFIVEDDITRDSVWWGDINMKFPSDKFDTLYNKVVSYLEGQEVYVRDSYACADHNYRLNIRVVTETAYQNIFANNLFLRPDASELENITPDWRIVAAPGFKADPEIDGTRQHNFAIINFTKKVILIGGTGYTGEIKKGIFSVLNFILPHDKGVLSMHCSANIGQSGDTAVFFGLSGTGKTTLSADPDRDLIGDDEHGWTDNTVFNFEGGCYAKVIDLSHKKEPQIWDAIKYGALVENINFKENTRTPDYTNTAKTQNTRAAYPIDHISNAKMPSIGDVPKNIFLLTCDAFGVLPPISKLSKGQTMYHFISGYTAKVAGTEAGVTEPQTVFSACFGAPFLPLHPATYADMLGEKIDKYDVNVWLINTGWTGGPHGVGERIKLKYTRAMITAALKGELNNMNYQTTDVFGLRIPESCPGVPSEMLDARNTWTDKNAFDNKANTLAEYFINNFEKYREGANKDTINAAPVVTTT